MSEIEVTALLRQRYPDLTGEQIRARARRWRNQAPGTLYGAGAKQKLGPG